MKQPALWTVAVDSGIIKLSVGRTVIAIIPTFYSVEQIRWWCWQGRIVEQGGYQELLQRALKYHQCSIK